MKALTSLAVLAALTVGTAAQAAPNTVEFYLANAPARKATLARCDKDPAQRNAPECVSARKAAVRAASIGYSPVSKSTGYSPAPSSGVPISSTGPQRYVGQTF